MLLGMGMNGHLGLNEPGTPFDLYSHIVKLDDVTRNVGQKYFSGKVVLSEGISLGLKSIMESKTVILQVSGTKKTEVVRKLIDAKVSPEFPASKLKEHVNSFLILDKDASVVI